MKRIKIMNTSSTGLAGLALDTKKGIISESRLQRFGQIFNSLDNSYQRLALVELSHAVARFRNKESRLV